MVIYHQKTYWTIYAVLHSSSYRQKYSEFLKIDFPRIPPCEDKKLFESLVKLGRELRLFHLMEHELSAKLITKYPIPGDNEVLKPKSELDNIYINNTQFFQGISEEVWNFYIGGYQPAQKRLKDRKNKKLGYEEIMHYQKIIVALSNTIRLMAEIDAIWKI